MVLGNNLLFHVVKCVHVRAHGVLLVWYLRRCRREWRVCREHWDRNGDVEGAGAGAPLLCGCWVAVSGHVAELLAVMLVLLARLGACGGTLGVSPPMRDGW